MRSSFSVSSRSSSVIYSQAPPISLHGFHSCSMFLNAQSLPFGMRSIRWGVSLTLLFQAPFAPDEESGFLIFTQNLAHSLLCSSAIDLHWFVILDFRQILPIEKVYEGVKIRVLRKKGNALKDELDIISALVID